MPPPYEAGRAWDVYGASKVQSEQLMWEYVKERKPAFVANAVVPNAIWGPILLPGKQQHISAAGFITGIYDIGLDFVKMIPPRMCDVNCVICC